ncbi:MAG: hypothetical protein WB341_12690 [Terracidiphilus sp.]
MLKWLFAAFFLVCCLAVTAQQALNNDAVVKLVTAGLSDDLIVSTINVSPGTYDTSADGLNALKTAGVSDKIMAAIVTRAAIARKSCAAPASGSSPADKTCPNAGRVNSLNRYTVDYVHSDRKWSRGLGMGSDEYDEISNDIQTELVNAMDHKGFIIANASEAACCKFTIELLRVKSRLSGPMTHRTLWVELAANFTFEDGNGHLVYKKGYVTGNPEEDTWRQDVEWIKQLAVLQLAGIITSDESFGKSLHAGDTAK